ncbi:MAG: flavodoxin-dependent (E)-4-hydroxy-3-methylbut-2-enyl-diphosphate synthase [Planctomycetes bacterium]|nr:flavodoxin-dependent (E)-4-hydroxy-3-methylbut-2-enyl-diphosphate synthase [Planctomycetota bacterium]
MSQKLYNLEKAAAAEPEVKVTNRKPTRTVQAGPITIGGGSLITVQSMTTVNTYEIDKCVEQINQLAKADCELIRVTVPSEKDTAALPEILAQSPIPVIADVHFNYKRAIEAIEAGVCKIRLNPGNIKVRRQVEEVIAACKANNVAIRVGVNEGSIVERRDQDLRADEIQQELISLMLEKLEEYIHIFEDNQFDNLVLAAKCCDAARCIVVNRAISEKFDYPLHLGVTHSGTVETGSVRSATAIGTLLAEGIGDTIRVSLAGDPVKEVEVGWEILNSLYLRKRRKVELIACPTCGRVEVDLFEMVEEVTKALADTRYPIRIAVMGCVVNGPGEADGADLAISAGRNKVMIYRQGKVVETVPADIGVETLLKHVNQHIAEETATKNHSRTATARERTLT